MSGMPRLILIVLCLMAIGCRSGKVPAAAALPKPDPRISVDLEPGWRIRVITPLVAGGGYKPKLKEVERGNTITLQVGDDFLGYETAYYDIGPDSKIRFTSAELMRDGKASPQAKPLHPLFAARRGTKHVRLVYLERGTSTIHDMAVVSARNLTTLEELTAKVRSSPADGCNTGCEWVPAGIAVRAEKQKDGKWAPAH